MVTFFAILFLLSSVGLITGLFSPRIVIKWGKKRTRGQVFLWYGFATFVFFIMIGVTAPPVPKQGNVTKSSREIDQGQQNNLPASDTSRGSTQRGHTETQLTKEPIKIVRLIIEESYPADVAKRKSFVLPFDRVAIKFLKYAGLSTTFDNKKYDATLRIVAEGKASGAFYKSKSKKGIYKEPTYRSTGGSLSGVISLEIPGLPIHKMPFQSTQYPPETIGQFGYIPPHEVFNVLFENQNQVPSYQPYRKL